MNNIMKNNKIKKNILRIVLLILILCWMYVVFGFSNADGEESAGLSAKIARLFVKNEMYVKFAEGIIRKLAHLTEYAIGGILIYSFVLTYKLRSKLQFIFSWLFVIAYAITDEVHQLFIPGRTGRIVDVYIDALGALIGICGVLFIMKILENRNNNIK